MIKRIIPWFIAFLAIGAFYTPSIRQELATRPILAQYTESENTKYSIMDYSWRNLTDDIVNSVYIAADPDTCGEFTLHFQVASVIDSSTIIINVGFTLDDSSSTYTDTVSMHAQLWLPGSKIGAGLPDSLFALVLDNTVTPEGTAGFRAQAEIKNEVVPDGFVLRGTNSRGTRAAVTLPLTDREVYDGHYWYTQHTATLGSGDSTRISITPGTKKIHVKASVIATGAGYYFFVDAPTSTGGTSASVYNRNMATSGSIEGVIKHSPTWISGSGTTIVNQSIGARKTLFTGADEIGWILKADTTYIFGIASTSADNISTLILELFECTHK